MRRSFPVLAAFLVWAGWAQAHGLLIPEDKKIPPLAMLNHQVNIGIEDQVAITRVEQTFRNHTDRPLEATYVFPVPRGAGVRKFSMWINGKEVAGEMVEADKARQIYTDIVRRTQDPGLLEYMGNNLLRMKVFPVPARADQKVAIRYTSVAQRDSGMVEYIYPLKTDGRATSTLEKFSILATIKAQHPIQTIYSPTHAISYDRPNDREAVVHFERNQAPLDKDFQLYYSVGDQDVGLTTLTHRMVSNESGYFMLLVSPRVEMAKEQRIPRDMVLVLDTSGSMQGVKMDQAKKALRFCLDNLASGDRFGMINFATTVNKYASGLVPSDKDQIEQAKKWVDGLEAVGGTAINDALAAALEMRSNDTSRTFTIVFFTDGLPTVGELSPDKILRNVTAKNTANTRIFTFGVGDDVNATMLDQLADQTRAVSTYVRPAEDIEAKVSSLYSKISHPVLANLKLSVGGDVRLAEIYPPQLPDLFHGGQVVVLGRYAGQGHTALKLTGTVGKESREFAYDIDLPARTNDDKSFVEHIWARRKVGYLLDQIRANGQTKELVDEVVALAKKYGIATPFTSYLIVPDAPVPVAQGGRGTYYSISAVPPALRIVNGPQPQKVADFARGSGDSKSEKAAKRNKAQDDELKAEAGLAAGERKLQLKEAMDRKDAFAQASAALRRRNQHAVQSGKLGVDLSVDSQRLRSQSKLSPTALRQVVGRNCLEMGGVWIDEDFDAKMPTLTIKAQSDAYFRILEKHPKIKEVFQLGNYVVWVAPSGTALVIDSNDGKEKLTDAEIDKLFLAKK